MNTKTLSLLISAACTLAGLVSGLTPARAEAAPSATTGITAEAGQQALRLSVRGEGKPLLMIPGLNSAASVWDETCERLQPGVRCLMVQLPGFAGLPSSTAFKDQFLRTSKDQLLALLRKEAPEGATVVGHSLGGVLALMMAAEEHSPVKRLVIVDSLPFLPAIQNPAATVESVRPMAEGMRAGMQQPSSPDQLRARLTPMASTMARGTERVETIVQWGLSSDRLTSADAMYEMWTLDLRPQLPRIQVPTTVLGSWAAYARMGSTEASTRAIFERQYQGLGQLDLRMSEAGYHFLMWDDPALVTTALQQALR